MWFFEYPVDFVVVAGACVDHDVFVSVEEHEGHLIVEFVHGVEVWDFGDVDYVEGDEVAEFVGYFHDDFVHLHAFGVPVVAEADDDEFLWFGYDGLVYFPAVVEVGEEEGHLKEIINYRSNSKY